jgi:hypothetical protein
MHSAKQSFPILRRCLRSILLRHSKPDRLVGEAQLLTADACAKLLESVEDESRRLLAAAKGRAPVYNPAKTPPKRPKGKTSTQASSSQASSSSGPSLSITAEVEAREWSKSCSHERLIEPASVLVYYSTLASIPTPEFVDFKDLETEGEASDPASTSGSVAENDHEEEDPEKEVDLTITPMPQKPYYIDLAKVLCMWAEQSSFPIKFAQMEGQSLLATLDPTEHAKSLTPKLQSVFQHLESSSDTNSLEKLLFDFIQALNIRGILTCLRVRQTFKSVDDFPPSCERLIASLNETHAAGVKLTVGARALSKHAHRSSDGWWGTTTGPDELKNKNAEQVVRKIFANASWINLHLLPHDLVIFEVRTLEGYGARWSGDGCEFRGFIEPQMQDGHEKGWRH